MKTSWEDASTPGDTVMYFAVANTDQLDHIPPAQRKSLIRNLRSGHGQELFTEMIESADLGGIVRLEPVKDAGVKTGIYTLEGPADRLDALFKDETYRERVLIFSLNYDDVAQSVGENPEPPNALRYHIQDVSSASAKSLFGSQDGDGTVIPKDPVANRIEKTLKDYEDSKRQAPKLDGRD